MLLARVGSDTFGILGPTREVALGQLLDCARQPLAVDGVPHKVSLTCGYVHLPRERQAGTDLVKDATIALNKMIIDDVLKNKDLTAATALATSLPSASRPA